MDNLNGPAKGSFQISTTWTSTGPFKTQTAAFPTAAIAQTQGSVTRAIFVGGAGNLKVIMVDGSTGLFTGVQPGSLLPLRAIALSSGNTATSLSGVY